MRELAFFAWQEFIALNWVAMDPATTGIRGRPDPATDPNTGFLDIAPDANGNFPLLVWQTYRHKNELFPYDKSADTNFDSNSPTYSYRRPVPTPATGGPIPSFTLFNNLDETSQIGLDNMYAHIGIQPPATGPSPLATGNAWPMRRKSTVPYSTISPVMGIPIPPQQADYQVMGHCSLPETIHQVMTRTATIFFPAYGGRCDFPMAVPRSRSFCCHAVVSPRRATRAKARSRSRRRGANWTPGEVSSGKFFMRNVIYYTGSQGKQQYNNEVWGLIALHIIHKTITFPGFVFATFEQIDNYLDDNPDSPNPETLAFQNLQPRTAAPQLIILQCDGPIQFQQPLQLLT